MVEKKLLFSKNYSIRWQDMDSFKHVNHTIYFVYLQECRIDWLKHHNISLNSPIHAPIVGEISCKYLRSITYPANITVELYFNHRSGRRVFFDHIIRDADNPELIYTTASVTVVWIDLITGRSIIPPIEYDHILEETVICQ
jgi:acyl-CoA thioester hydrolase